MGNIGASTAKRNTYRIATRCLICEEPVFIPDWSERPKICDKCKEAVMSMRKQIEKGSVEK